MNKSCVLLLASCFQGLLAQAAPPHRNEPATLNVLVENDGFAATDHHYTSGFEVSWLSPALSNDSAASRIVEWLPGNGGQVRSGWLFGQTIFTPKDKAAEELIPAERPYAAWLYGGASIVSVTPAHVDTLSLLVGTVGPHALGEPLQHAVHEWLHFEESRGWRNQVGNRIGGLLIVERKWRPSTPARIGRLDADFLPHAGISLGNIETYANAGFTVRIGDNVGSDFGPPRIRPSLPGSSYFVPRGDLSWYVFVGMDGRYVERNIFLDDNELSPLLEIDKERWVTDVQAGFVVTQRSFRLACTFVHRSQEYAQQSEPDRFGSVALTWRF